MSSLLAYPLQMINVGVEILFIANKKLHSQPHISKLPEGCRTDVLEDVAKELLDILSTLFVPTTLLSPSEIADFFKKSMDRSCLRIPADSFEKWPPSSVVSGLRLWHSADVVSITEDKLRDLRDLVKADPVKEEITRLKNCFLSFYSSLIPGELARVRLTLLNYFSTMNYPVEVLISRGFQAADGTIKPSTDGQSTANLGATVLYNLQGRVVEEYVLPIAGRGSKEPSVYSDTWNLFAIRSCVDFDKNATPPLPLRGLESQECIGRPADGEVQVRKDSLCQTGTATENEGEYFRNRPESAFRAAGASYAQRLEASKCSQSYY